MKSVLMFPINIFIYAGKGIRHIFKLLTGEKTYEDKLEGKSLYKELERVKQESNDFKRNNVEDINDKTMDTKEKSLQFKYVVKASNGSKLKGKFEAATKDDVRIFLENSGYEIISIEPCKRLDFDVNITATKINNSDLAFMLTQLSTYIKAGIPLIDSVRILAKQTSKQSHRKVLDKVVYELITGQKFSVALEKQKNTFPRLLVNMVKTSEMTGDLAGTLDEMAEYYTEIEASRKQMISALIYPSVILIMAIAALIFVIVVVVPKFQDMFTSTGGELPGITKFVLSLSNFFRTKWIYLVIILLSLIVIYRLLYKNVRTFRKVMQTIFMKLPVIGKIIIYNEVSTMTRTFSSLLNHSVFITDSMDILSKISENEIYKDIINRTLIGLSKGNKISETFKDEWAFPIVAYEMLVTGENTGQLAVMMSKVAEHYQNLHKNAVTAIKSLIEPIIICLLAVGVGFIILSIVIPMFDMYNQYI